MGGHDRGETLTLDRTRVLWHEVNGEVVAPDLGDSVYLPINELCSRLHPRGRAFTMPRVQRRVVIACAVALSAAGCGGGGGKSASRPRGAAPLPAGSRLLSDVAEPLSGGYTAGGSLYYAETTPIGEHVGEAYELSRLDLRSGRVTATRRFGATLDDMLVASGGLWVTTSAGNHTTLWRLHPDTLAVRSKVALPSARATEGIAGSLAAAGGSLWVGAGTLDRVSLATARVEGVLTPPYPGPVQVAADPSGRILMASLGYARRTYLARLNPATGAEIAHVDAGLSLGQPSFAGIVDGGAWVENSTGTSSTAWRLDVRSLRVTKTSGWAVKARRVGVQIHAGRLWVTEPLGEDNLNYCADPVTGRPLVRLPPLPGDSVFLTAGASDFYYTDVPLNSHAVRVEAAPINRACTA